jgi:hypothetical protein
MMMPWCGGQGGVTGDQVGLRRRVSTDLAGKGEGAKAAGDCDELVTVGVPHLRGKKSCIVSPS